LITRKKLANYYSKENLIYSYCKLTKLTKKLGFEGYPVNIFLDENGIIKITGNVPVIEK
jgi:hypothetical protein